MRVLSVHNYYQHRGGEEQVFESEAANLEAHGHQVIRYTAHNDALRRLGSLRVAWTLIWNPAAYREVRSLIHRERPDVCHCHNTFPLISPAVYAAARAEGVPVVQTLHNYRLLCPAATFFRHGRICQECLGRALPWPSVIHGCYRGSRLQTAAAALMLVVHRLRRTWVENVDLYIAPAEFARDIFVARGFAAQAIAVKPNYPHPDPGARGVAGSYVLFVGRMAPEKGVRTLLRAWEGLPQVPLKVAGAGALGEEAKTYLRDHRLEHVQLLGRVAHEQVLSLMKGAYCLVFPSEWFEVFPVTIVEAFACGIPVIVSRLGSLPEIVKDGHTGLHFRPGDAEDLASKVAWAVSHPEEVARMGRMARLEYEARYSAERNYEMLIGAYRRAMDGAGGARRL